ncbi:MAG: hypothetical protein ACOYI2_07090 [Bacillota bacterium]|jgi:hypothetical protein
MSDIFYDFRPEISSSHLDRLERSLPGINGHDYVTVIMEKEDAHEADSIVRILSQNGFRIESKGALATEFAITAKRLMH